MYVMRTMYNVSTLELLQDFLEMLVTRQFYLPTIHISSPFHLTLRKEVVSKVCLPKKKRFSRHTTRLKRRVAR